jgi:hypothetical protein
MLARWCIFFLEKEVEFKGVLAFQAFEIAVVQLDGNN